MYQGISLTQAPPLAVVFGFFLNAQVYLGWAGILGLVEAWQGGFSLQGIYFIHCFSIGFLLLMMFGPLANAACPRWRATAIPQNDCDSYIACLNFGLVAFIAAFRWNLALFGVALVLLVLGILIFVGSVVKLREIEHFTPTIMYMCAALVSLLLTAGFGATLLGGYAQWWDMPSWLTRFHFSLGGLGWIGLLIVGVSLQVLPMFYVAPTFPKMFFVAVVPLLLLAFALSLGFGLEKLALAFGGGFITCFGALGLSILSRRKRKIKEASITFWRIGLGAFMVAGVLMWGAIGLEVLVNVSINVFVGGVMAIVYAMMYKIVPFLTWFHLSYNGVLELPNMRETVPQRIIKAHLILFIMGFGCALLWQMPLFAGLFCIICVLLSLIAGFALCKAYRIYAHTLKTAPRMKF